MGKTSISQKANAGATPLIVMGAFFGLFGLGFIVFGFVPAVLGVVKAQSWVRTPCVIDSSKVQSHSDSDGTTYSIVITYTYEYDGQTYTSNRYQFMGGSSSGHAGKAQVVREHPPGSERYCYVNPDDPSQAVINRSFTADMLWMLLPGIFVVAGLAMAAGGVKMRRKVREPASAAPTPVKSGSSRIAPPPRRQTGPMTLKPHSSPMGNLIGALIFAVVWNGIVSVFIYQAVQGWIAGKPDYCLTAFMIPFVVVGLGAFVGVGYCLLALFNPRPTLTVNTDALPPGHWLEIKWQLSGSTQRVGKLIIRIEGREEATYKSGKNSRTDKHTFATIEILETTRPAEIAGGRKRVQIPPGAMHSFDSANNRIAWCIIIHGEIANWPDVKHEFPLTVLPLPLSEIRTDEHPVDQNV